jgi:ADP-glucose pyrophosphorylase
MVMKIENDYIALLMHDRLIIKHPKTEKETILYRIIAKKSFIVENEFISRPIDAYKIGGFVENIDTMDNENFSWIDNRCRVFGNLKISNSVFTDNVIAFGDGYIKNSIVKHNSRIYLQDGNIESCEINDLVEIKGSPNIKNCKLYNSAMIFETPTVINTTISGGSIIRGFSNVDNCILTDVSQIQGKSIVKNCKLQNRSVILEGEHNNSTFSEDIILNIVKG